MMVVWLKRERWYTLCPIKCVETVSVVAFLKEREIFNVTSLDIYFYICDNNCNHNVEEITYLGLFSIVLDKYIINPI